MNDPRNNPKRDWLMVTLSNAPIQNNYQNARYKAELMLEVCDELEAEIEEFNQAEGSAEAETPPEE